MKIVALVRPAATRTVEGNGIGVEELRTSVLEQLPGHHELTQLLVGSGRVEGNLVGTGTFQSIVASEIEAEGLDYASAKAALDARVPSGSRVLYYRVIHENSSSN